MKLGKLALVGLTAILAFGATACGSSTANIINDGIIINIRISRRIIECSRYFRGQRICRRSTESSDRYSTGFISDILY